MRKKKGWKSGNMRQAPEVRDATGMFNKMRRLNYREDIHLQKEISAIETLRRTSLKQMNADITRVRSFAKRANIPVKVSSDPVSYTDIAYHTDSNGKKPYGFSYCTCSQCIQRPKTSITRRSTTMLTSKESHQRISKSAPSKSNLNLKLPPNSARLQVPFNSRTSTQIGNASPATLDKRPHTCGSADVAVVTSQEVCDPSEVLLQLPNSSPISPRGLSPRKQSGGFSPWKQVVNDKLRSPHSSKDASSSWAWKREPEPLCTDSFQTFSSLKIRSPGFTHHPTWGKQVDRPKMTISKLYQAVNYISL